MLSSVQSYPSLLRPTYAAESIWHGGDNFSNSCTAFLQLLDSLSRVFSPGIFCNHFLTSSLPESFFSFLVSD